MNSTFIIMALGLGTIFVLFAAASLIITFADIAGDIEELKGENK